MDTREYRLHQGARTALNVAAILCMVLIVAIPFGAWIMVRVAGGKLIVSAQGLIAKALGTVQYDWKDVERIGLVSVPIVARGIGGMLARKKVGGDYALNVCVILRSGKKRMFTVSMYEDHRAALEQITAAAGKPYEDLKMGVFGVKWPETKAA